MSLNLNQFETNNKFYRSFGDYINITDFGINCCQNEFKKDTF